MHSVYSIEDASSAGVPRVAGSPATGPVKPATNGQTCLHDGANLSKSARRGVAPARCTKNDAPNRLAIKEEGTTSVAPATLQTEASLDILSWLARAVLETEDAENTAQTFTTHTKSEPVDEEFDLLQYVDSPLEEEVNVSFDEQTVLDALASIHPPKSVQSTDAHSRNSSSADRQLQEKVFCPSSPAYDKSQEIVDYPPEDTVGRIPDSISFSPIFHPEEMEEPNWLSTWDSF